MKYFESRTYGEVLSRITNDVDTLGMGLNQSVTQIITSTATIIGVLVMMLSISPLMTLIALVVLPVSGLCVSLVVKKSQKHFITQQEYLGHINGQVEESYGGHLVIKAYNKEDEMIAQFNQTNDVLYTSAWKSQVPLRNHDADHAVYRKPWLCGSCTQRRYAGNPWNYYHWRYSGVFIQYVKSFHTADPADRTGNKIRCSPWAAAAERVFEFLEERGRKIRSGAACRCDKK